MADRKKFEEMLERLINEDKEGAQAIFHELVVEKSREIYENLLEDDEDIEEASDDEEVDEAAKDEEEDEDKVDEASEADDDEETNEDFNLDEFEVEADPMAAMGGDPADDMMGDIEMGGDEEGEDDMGGEGDVEDRVEDLEDALEELKAEFEKLMADEGGEEEHGDMDMDMGGDEEGDEGEEDEGDEEKEAFNFGEAKEKKDDKKADKKDKKSSAEQMREYVEKVTATMGDNGANTKSTVASKNDMGGTAKNLNQAGTEKSPVEANKGQLKGSSLFKGSEKEDNAGNVNVPGGKAAKSLKAQPKGHGAEKKGAGETADNKKSTIGSK